MGIENNGVFERHVTEGNGGADHQIVSLTDSELSDLDTAGHRSRMAGTVLLESVRVTGLEGTTNPQQDFGGNSWARGIGVLWPWPPRLYLSDRVESRWKLGNGCGHTCPTTIGQNIQRIRRDNED